MFTHCTIRGCKSPHEDLGLCHRHLTIWRQKNPDKYLRMRPPRTYPDDSEYVRMFLGRTKWKGKCLIYNGIKDAPRKSKGEYGSFHYRGNPTPAHRWFYEFIYPKKPFPKKLVFSHTCGNKRCLIHGRPATQSENMQIYYDYERYGIPIPDRFSCE